jgi:peroxiredoxin
MFCREQAARVTEAAPVLHALGARTVLIGTGSPAQARRFATERGLTVPVWVDTERTSYDRAGMVRGFGATLGNLSVWGHGLRAAQQGFRQGATAGDPWQNGGVLVVDGTGEVRWAFRSAVAGDHPAVDAIVEAVRTLGSAG